MKKLIYFLIPLFIFIPKVKADFVGSFSFLGYGLDSEFSIGSNGSKSGVISFNNTTSNISTSSHNYMYIDLCTTGYEPTLWITSNTYGTMAPSTKWYQLNTSCYTSGYQAAVYRQIIYITSSQIEESISSDYAYSVNESRGTLFSNTDYTAYMRILHIGITPDIPLDEIILQQDQTRNDLLNDIKNSFSSQNSTLNDIEKNTEDTKNAIKDTNDTLKDDTVDNSSLNIDDKSADLGNSPVSDLITLPIKLLTNIYNGFSGSCVSYNLGSLYGTQIIFPCINLESILGSFLWGLIDSLCCIFLIYKIAMLFVSMWTKIVTMKDVFTSIYTPGGGN